MRHTSFTRWTFTQSFSYRDDRKLTRQSTCKQLRDYINIPIDGFYAKNKIWKTASYRKVHYEVVILNGPCRVDIGQAISFLSPPCWNCLHDDLLKYIDDQTIVIVPGYNLKTIWEQITTLSKLYHIVEKNVSKGRLGYVILKK